MSNLVLYIHLTFLALAALGIALADSEVFAWMRGRVPTLSRKSLNRTHWIVTIALSGLVLTGLYMFWPMRAYLLHQPLFLLKMVFVLALLLNSFVIETLMPVMTQYEHQALPARKQLQLMVSGGISTISWISAALTAIFLFGWLF